MPSTRVGRQAGILGRDGEREAQGGGERGRVVSACVYFGLGCISCAKGGWCFVFFPFRANVSGLPPPTCGAFFF